MKNGRKKIGSGEVGRFDQKNIIFNRTSWDPLVKKDGQRYYGPHVFGDKPGYSLKDWSFSQAAWNLERRFGHASLVGDFGLTQWEMSREEIERTNRMAPGQVYEVSDPENMSRDVKNVATFLGASLVGICKLDPRGSILINTNGSLRIIVQLIFLKNSNMQSSWLMRWITSW